MGAINLNDTLSDLIYIVLLLEATMCCITYTKKLQSMVVTATTALFICVSQQNVTHKESKQFYYFMAFYFCSYDYDRLV
jgi:hypothetical protein